jgi:DNA-binding response OmpR family regulator
VNVLIVEDDDSVARLLDQAMSEAGYIPKVAGDGPSAVELAREGGYDLILLDVMLPGFDGFEVCRRIRSAGVLTPVLMLTAKDMTVDKVQGLDCGADDYIVKPFQVAELMARARAVMRRASMAPGVVKVNDLTLDPLTRKVTKGERLVYLSSTEYTLLEFLMRNAGRVLPRAMILQHVWNYDFDGNDNVLDVYISYLRKKLDRGDNGSHIQTVRGIGYMMEAASEA